MNWTLEGTCHSYNTLCHLCVFFALGVPAGHDPGDRSPFDFEILTSVWSISIYIRDRNIPIKYLRVKCFTEEPSADKYLEPTLLLCGDRMPRCRQNQTQRLSTETDQTPVKHNMMKWEENYTHTEPERRAARIQRLRWQQTISPISPPSVKQQACDRPGQPVSHSALQWTKWQ